MSQRSAELRLCAKAGSLLFGPTSQVPFQLTGHPSWIWNQENSLAEIAKELFAAVHLEPPSVFPPPDDSFLDNKYVGCPRAIQAASNSSEGCVPRRQYQVLPPQSGRGSVLEQPGPRARPTQADTPKSSGSVAWNPGKPEPAPASKEL